MINTLYLSYDGMTDPLGQSQVIPYLEGLTKAGYNITLISFEKAERANRTSTIAQRLEKSNIDWKPLNYTKRPPVLSTLWDVYKLRKTVTALHKKKNFQLVHCRSYITALVGLWLKRKLKMPFVFDMRGFFADERLDGGIWTLESPIFKKVYEFFKKKEIEFFSEADHSISLTHNGANIIHSWEKIKNQPIPIAVIPCSVDTELFDAKNISEEAQEELRKELDISAKQQVLSYLGSIGTWYMLPEMMAFFKVLVEKQPNWVFFFITAEDPTMILEEAERQGVSPDHFRIKQAEREQVPLMLSLSDASLFFIKPVFSKKASSPTKQGEMMAMGIPLVCNREVGDTDYVVETYNAGFLTNDFSEAAYAEAVENLPKILALDKTEIRNGAIDFYALSKGVEKYRKVYETVLGK
ncbi:glycosyltransferase [Flammeovirgaceae bacterium SG7u.111]|nr:glycosyltransferase [Flammeovirgaceae bacterium SG7u.132]WPO35961.1 glycosyltransferase [Flammeovirgaceae bacterium SG7u.111]